MKKCKAALSAVLLSALLSGCQASVYDAGMEQLENGKYQEAADSFQASIEREKNVEDSYRGLGMALWEQEDYAGSKEAFENALSKGAKETGTLYNFLGTCEMKLKNYESAVGYYEKGLALDEKDSGELRQEMAYNIIVCYEKLEDWEQAKEKLSEYTKAYPEDERAAKEAQFWSTR